MVPLSGTALSSISRVFDVNVPLCTSAGNLSVKGLNALTADLARGNIATECGRDVVTSPTTTDARSGSRTSAPLALA